MGTTENDVLVCKKCSNDCALCDTKDFGICTDCVDDRMLINKKCITITDYIQKISDPEFSDKGEEIYTFWL